MSVSVVFGILTLAMVAVTILVRIHINKEMCVATKVFPREDGSCLYETSCQEKTFVSNCDLVGDLLPLYECHNYDSTSCTLSVIRCIGLNAAFTCIWVFLAFCVFFAVVACCYMHFCSQAQYQQLDIP